MAKAVKKTTKKTIVNKKIESILITQPRPESDKSPYFDMAKKYNIKIDFYPFIILEGLTAKEFRRQKIELSEYTGIILLSRNAVEHFFRICEEVKYKVPQDLRYFCISEAVALYLQKFILYRKRKVFFSADGSVEGLRDVLQKYKDKAKFLLPVSENTKNDIAPLLLERGFDFKEVILYRNVATDIKKVMKESHDLLVFFSPFSVDTLVDYVKKHPLNGSMLAAFGNNTAKAIEDAGLPLSIKAPMPGQPSMVSALTAYLDANNK